MKIEIQNELIASQASITTEASPEAMPESEESEESEESKDWCSVFHSELSGIHSLSFSGQSVDGSNKETRLPYLMLESKNETFAVLDSQYSQKSAVSELREVPSDDFETKFGKDLADFLKQMRAESVKFDGNKVTLNLIQNFDLKADLGIFSGVKIWKNASVEVYRRGEAICVTDSHGIKLDGIKDFPSVKIYRGAEGQADRASFKNLPGGFNLPPGSYARIDSLLKRIGR